MIKKNLQSYIDELDAWDHSQTELESSDIFVNNPISFFRQSGPKRRQKKKKKKKISILPNLSKQKQKSSSKQPIKTFHKCNFIKAAINQDSNRKDISKKIKTMSSQRSLLQTKYFQTNNHTVSVKDLQKRMEQISKNERIKKELEEKEKSLKSQAYILTLKGTKFFSNEQSKRDFKKGEKKMIHSQQKSYKQIKEKIQKMEDSRVNWWRKFLEQKKSVKSIKKQINVNLSDNNIKWPEENRKNEAINRLKEKILLRNRCQRQRQKKEIQGNESFYLNLNSFEEKVNRASEKNIINISPRFLDDHISKK